MKQVSEQTVLIVGLGGIGAETARLLKGFGATVLGVKRTAEPVPNVDEVHGIDGPARAWRPAPTPSSSPCPEPTPPPD